MRLLYFLVFIYAVLCEVPSDYELYDLIDTLNTLTTHSTFYQLLNVLPEATIPQISAQYRKMSASWHPDKNPEDSEAEKKFALLSSVYTVLKNAESKARYDWLINEAPAWHRSSYYYRKYLTAKLSVVQVVLIAFLFVSVVQVVGLYAKYFSDLYHHQEHVRTVKDMGSKELKRLMRKTESSSLLSSEMVSLKKSEMGVEKPKLRDLLLWKLVVSVLYVPKFLLVSIFRGIRNIGNLRFLFQQKKKEKIEDSVDHDKKPKVKRRKQFESDDLRNQFDLDERKQSGSDNLTSSTASSVTVIESESSVTDAETKYGPFSEQETQHLIQLMSSIPAGTVGRWIVVAKKLNRSVDDVIAKVHELKSKLK